MPYTPCESGLSDIDWLTGDRRRLKVGDSRKLQPLPLPRYEIQRLSFVGSRREVFAATYHTKLRSCMIPSYDIHPISNS